MVLLSAPPWDSHQPELDIQHTSDSTSLTQSAGLPVLCMIISIFHIGLMAQCDCLSGPECCLVLPGVTGDTRTAQDSPGLWLEETEKTRTAQGSFESPGQV